MCSSRSDSLDKVNKEFPALALDTSLKKMTEPELDVVLGILTSFVDLRSAASGKKMDQAVRGLEQRVKEFGLFGEIGHC
eukprot:6081456-Prorocentrum_lima.AAC.1